MKFGSIDDREERKHSGAGFMQESSIISMQGYFTLDTVWQNLTCVLTFRPSQQEPRGGGAWSQNQWEK